MELARSHQSRIILRIVANTMKDLPLLSSIFCEIEPTQNLCKNILSRIAYARRRAARIMFVIQTSVCFMSGMLLLPLTMSIGREFYTSGFYEYASLFFSTDLASISNLSSELTYSLIESIPSLTIVGMLIAGATLLWSLSQMMSIRKEVFIELPRTV